MQPSDQREREADGRTGSIADDLLDGGESAPSTGKSASSAGGAGRLERVFSPRAFLLALLFVGGGAIAGGFFGGFVPLLGMVAAPVGLFAGAFLGGLLYSRRRYVETGVAGALVAVLWFVLSTLGTFPLAVGFLAERGTVVAGVGAGTGLLAAVAGHYFGRDLRAGLTGDI